ncbi:dihydrofolate reductase family protein [Azohydromonas caseinilytica]|uniref:Dihydrofolate reductase n=1 Tax=Azohydromonas caseinilytica TaxID=2728836 RepID=A0A848FCB0_9BURK|nr:dihydrofolate reductase family protein [Azohydromonas caseinilytica]NML16586.1 dihydrofolate reductase [Azohydromonas caseinilytica]
MKTQYYTASSLDGFIATPDHSLDWLLQFGTDGGSSYEEFIAQVGAIAMGSHTYEWILRNHVRPANGPAQPWMYAQPAWVFSHREVPAVDGADIRFVRGDVAPVHAAMARAAAGKNLWIVGGGELAAQFHDQGLLDEIIVTIVAVTLGQGRPLFPRAITSPPLELKSVRPHGEAFAELRYAVPRR